MADSPPTCGGCGMPVTENLLFAFGMHWHSNHLACKVCGRDFSDGSKVEEGPDGFAYCTSHFLDTFAPKCGICNNPIVGECLNALNKAFHPSCFVCKTCNMDFRTKPFFTTEDGSIYCEQHYYTVMGMVCGECERPIVSGKCVRMGSKRFHPEHFVCAYCKKKLKDGVYYNKNEKPYCQTCYVKLFG